MSENTLAHTRDTNAPPPLTPLSQTQIREYLDYHGATLLARRDQIIAALSADAKAHPRIEDDEVLGEIGENMKMRAALGRTADDRRKDHKAPFLNGGRVVDAWFKSFLQPLDDIAAIVQRITNEYAERKLAEQRKRVEAEHVRAAEAERKANEAAAAALRKGRDAQAELDRVAAAMAAAERAEAETQARAPDLTRTRGIYGAVSSARESWGWEVEDITKVPREYMMLNPDAVKVAGKQRDASGKPLAVIPGIKWVVSTKMGFR